METNYKEVVFDQSTRTAAEAATALGCSVGQIAKSIIFKTDTEAPILVVASGANRINENLIEKELGLKVLKASADFVKEKTGYVIGGVAPWGHKQKMTVFIDIDLKQYDIIWASSGKTNAVFQLTFDELVEKTRGKVIRVA